MAVIGLSPAGVDIIMSAVDRIDNFDPNYYPTAENIAEYVSNTLVADEKVTIDDINISSAVIARKYPGLFGSDIDETATINILVEAFKSSLSARIGSSNIGKFALIFIITFLGYTMVIGGGGKR